MPDLIDKVAAIIVPDKKLMLIREEPKGLLKFPGGKREPGETDLECLERELQEELGAGIKETKYYGIFFSELHDKSVKLTCYLVQLATVPTPKEEGTSIVYVNSMDYEAQKGYMLPALQKILPKLVEEGLVT